MTKRYLAQALGLALLVGVVVCNRATAAMTPISDPNNGETHLYSALGYHDNGVYNQQWDNAQDRYFRIGGAVTTILLEAAGYRDRNIFGVYAPGLNSTRTMVDVFQGSAGPGAALTITFSGGHIYFGGSDRGAFPLNPNGEVGFYLRPNGSTTTTFYSDQSLNGGLDQMVTFSGTPGAIVAPDTDFRPESRFVVAWEDISYNSSDKDFNDMVLQMTVVPEPTTMIAGALLLLPFGVSTLRILRKKRAA